MCLLCEQYWYRECERKTAGFKFCWKRLTVHMVSFLLTYTFRPQLLIPEKSFRQEYGVCCKKSLNFYFLPQAATQRECKLIQLTHGRWRWTSDSCEVDQNLAKFGENCECFDKSWAKDFWILWIVPQEMFLEMLPLLPDWNTCVASDGKKLLRSPFFNKLCNST